MRQSRFAALPLFFCILAAAQPPNFALDITGTNVQQLMNLKITSLSKKQQSLNQAAAAVYVLSHDEIERLGVTHIADALRYVPGLEVARIDASRWAISIRGFNGRAANKLLVLIDGRSVYSPLFSGVLWEEKDVLLADVDRIEVIRGPGSAIWGANAVNGVINIITKTARASQGAFVDVGAGLAQRKVAQARFGWLVSDDAYVRIYGKHRQHQSTNEEFNNDDNQHNQFGFRLDYQLAQQSNVTVQGDVYAGNIGSLDSSNQPAGQQHSGGNLVVNWQTVDASQRKHKVLGYYDKTHLVTTGIDDGREIFNLDYQVEQQWQRHALVAGVGYRLIHDDVNTEPLNFIQPRYRHDKVVNAFFQDDISLHDDALHFIFGAKFEHNDYSGGEWLPNVRFSYQLSKSLFWGSWSKAVRVPTRFEKDLRFGRFSGEQLQPELANVYELGWRRQWSDTWLLDTTIYRGDYDDIQSIEANGYGNNISGKVQGVELSSSIQLQPTWSLRVNFSHANMSLSAASDSLSAARTAIIERQMPANTLQVISMWDLNSRWQFNSFIRYVDQLGGNNIDSYWSLDTTLRWQVAEHFSIQLAARNLGNGQHYEWDPQLPVGRDLLVNLRWDL